MRIGIIYSSRTGNTKQIAEAIHEVFIAEKYEAALYPVESAPDPEAAESAAFDLLCLGYWVDKGTADQKCLTYMEKVKGKKVALFGTLGAYPDSDHAKDCIRGCEKYMEENGGNTVLGTFLCMGKVDPKITAMMQKMGDKVHPMTPERQARLEEAAKHPNEQDCLKAGEAFLDFAKKAFA